MKAPVAVLKNVVQSLHKKFSGSREDMKEGHFAVLAAHEDGSKRFLVPLNCLSNPAFIRLLESAEEEYGFYQQSILTVPCHPSELENILAGKCKSERRNSFSSGLFKGPGKEWQLLPATQDCCFICRPIFFIYLFACVWFP